MATYKFEQFKVEIVNPQIEVDMNSIQDKSIDKLLSVGVTLTTQTASFGLIATDMPYETTWEDVDVYPMTVEWLSQFIV